jgi:hypothetical protein
MMIKHIVMWKLRDAAGAADAEGGTKAENALKVKASLEGLNGKIKGMRLLEVGININDSPAAYDVVLYSEFATRDDLEAYQQHPEHLKAGDFIGKVRLDRKVIDYEI